MARPQSSIGPTFTAAQIEALPDAAFVSDAGGRVFAWNSAIEALLGWRAQTALFSACATILEGVATDGSAVCRAPCPLAAAAGQRAVRDVARQQVPLGRAGWELNGHQGEAAAACAHPDMLVRRADGSRCRVVVIALEATVGGRFGLLHLLREEVDADRDALTGVLNRDGFTARAADEQHRAARRREPLAFALIDVDGLKDINDRLGHLAGDRALQWLADLLCEGRREDLVGRWGGDEFAVLLPNAGCQEAAYRLRRTLDDARSEVLTNPLAVSFSAGVVDVRASDTLPEIVKYADAALYRAKRRGRGRVVA